MKSPPFRNTLIAPPPQPHELQRQSPGDVHPHQIVPPWPRIGGGTGKGPKPEALLADLGKVSKTPDQTDWVRVKPRLADVEMLNDIEGYITDEWFRVDHEPRLPLGPQDVSGVKVGGK